MSSPGREVAQRDPYDVDVNPTEKITNLRVLMVLSDQLSQSTLVPESLAGKPANIFHVIMTGQELDLTWPVALRMIYSPGRGQTGIRGQLVLARLRRAGHHYRWEDTEDGCTFTLTRGDEPGEPPYVGSFTQEDAKTAGLTGKDNYQKYGRDMYFWRAVYRVVSKAAPEELLGMAIAEAMDEPAVQLAPAPPVSPGEAATGDPAAQDFREEALQGLRERLAEVDAQAREAAGAFPEPEAAAEAELEQAVAEVESTWAATPPAAEARNAVPDTLGGDFTLLGWPPRQYGADVRRACSYFAQRKIASQRELTDTETRELRRILGDLIRSNPVEPVIALQEVIEGWQQDWQENDPEGYQAYEEGQ